MNFPEESFAVFWFRRDLRLHDNHGLYRGLESGYKVLPLFIFDREILDDLPSRRDARVQFIHECLQAIKTELQKHGSDLLVMHDNAVDAWKHLLASGKVQAIYCNHDYEPYAKSRDAEVSKIAESYGVNFHSFKDQVVFEKDEVLKDDGSPYTIFTPYSKKWKSRLEREGMSDHPSQDHLGALLKTTGLHFPELSELGFSESPVRVAPPKWEEKKILDYASTRNLPYLDATTHLSVHLRFGTVSVRRLVRQAQRLSESWLNELIWREFFMQILWHFPFVVGRAFREEYEGIQWREAEDDFQKWCEGRTGFPLVDAGMRELNATGFMHNRVRMVVASFLTKDLLIDWRRGESYFAEKLLDFDLSANNGNWQWAAGTGCDAAPYFRVFNPSEQQKKFDPDFVYIRKWIPEFGTDAYPPPMLDHVAAKMRCLEAYKVGRGKE